MRRVLVVTIEGLGTNLVGCFGGAIAPTKNWDSFACRSLVFDQYWADTLNPADILQSMWSGVHFSMRNLSANSPLPASATELFGNGMLITDSVALVGEMDLDLFGDVLFVDSVARDSVQPMDSSADGAPTYSDLHDPESNDPESNDPESQLSHLIETALGRWASQLDAFPLLWIHSRGLNGPWDAPYEYRCVMCDEGDPDPPRGSEPARLQVNEETDPDQVFGMACAAGGQAIAMDEAWALIEEALLQLGISDECMLILAGASGYPIGEHGWVGCGQELYAETLHLPLIIRPGHQLNLGIRVPSIVQPDSILATLSSWVKNENSDINPSGHSETLLNDSDAFSPDAWPARRQVAFSCADRQQHMVVPAWSCRWSSKDGGHEKIELYAMPDDRWQQNEISQRAWHIAEQLGELRSTWELWRNRENDVSNEPLPSELTSPVR